jgi:lysozyme
VNKEELIKLIKKHEGLRLRPYQDTVDKWTIGWGRNLSDRGITEDEAEMMLMNDIDRSIYDLNYHLPWWTNLDCTRQMVMVDMCFNLGIFGLLTFKNTLSAIRQGDYPEASIQMMESKWAEQVGNRAKELSDMMRTGLIK